MKKILLLLVIALVFLSGCIVSRQMYYMTDEVKDEKTKVTETELETIYDEYRDQPSILSEIFKIY